jgi:hypothetical protein
LQTADLLMFQAWLNASAQHEPILQGFYRQRFRPEFAVAFEAWLRTEPLTNPAAPGSPFVMPEYHSTRMAEAQRLQKQADDLFAQGQKDNDVSDAFVRGTVLLADRAVLWRHRPDLQVDDDQGRAGRHGVRRLRGQRLDGRALPILSLNF